MVKLLTYFYAYNSSSFDSLNNSLMNETDCFVINKNELVSVETPIVGKYLVTEFETVSWK